MQIKTDFTELEPAIAYLKEIAPQVAGLSEAKESLEAEKRRILASRDEAASRTASKLEALEAELSQAQQALEAAKAKAPAGSDLEAQFADMKQQLEQKYSERLSAIEAERAEEKRIREQEQEQTRLSNIKAAAIAEFSKPEYGIINPREFFELHGRDLDLDETGDPYRKVGEFDKQTLAQIVEDIRSNADNHYKFKPKGGKGNDSPGAGSGSGGVTGNPFAAKSFNLTEQSRIMRENPALAARLKAEAGN